MNDIYSLLGINEDSFNNFYLQANSVADHQTEKVVNANVRRLKQIEEKMYTDSQIKVTLRSVDEVLKKVVSSAYMTDSNGIEWSSYELRIVSYYLMKLQGDDKAHDFGLDLLDKNWKSLYFNGLVFYVLNGWNLMRKDYRDKVCQLIVKKLVAYTDHNKKYLLLKNHSDFFDDNGPMRMSALIRQKKMSLVDAPTLIGYKPSTFSLSYYSDVIVKSLRGSHFSDPDILERIFEKHDLDRTKKLVFANYVEVADRDGDQFEQNQLSKYAHRTLGDISKSVTWTPFSGATDEEVNKLRNAKNLVNLWYVRKVIEVFFEVCVQDYARKIFWLAYANEGYIKDFRIAGSTLVRQKMQNDDRISNLFSRYFINTNSRISQTAALILYIKNKVMIEFSDTGAVYVYNRSNPIIGFIDKGRSVITSVNDLKNPNISLLVEDGYYSYTKYYNDEGRLTHRGEWQSRMRSWMQRKLINADIQEETTYTKRDDEIFQVKPLPSQSPAPSYKKDEPIYENDSKQSKHGKQIYQQSLEFSQDLSYKTINYKIESKWILGKFKVVANDRGFYINVKNKYVFVKEMSAGEVASGNIWVKHPKYGWFNVIHFDSGVTTNVGYVKIEGLKLYYKLLESDKTYKTIDL